MDCSTSTTKKCDWEFKNLRGLSTFSTQPQRGKNSQYVDAFRVKHLKYCFFRRLRWSKLSLLSWWCWKRSKLDQNTSIKASLASIAAIFLMIWRVTSLDYLKKCFNNKKLAVISWFCLKALVTLHILELQHLYLINWCSMKP